MLAYKIALYFNLSIEDVCCLVITGTELLNKDMQRVHIDLKNGKTDKLPEGVYFKSAKKEGNNWNVSFEADCDKGGKLRQCFQTEFYDADGKKYDTNGWSGTGSIPKKKGKGSYYIFELVLRDYNKDDVWLVPNFSHNWEAKKEIVVEIK